MTSYSGMKAWTFVNGLIYCLTVVTTIGKAFDDIEANHFKNAIEYVQRIRSHLSQHEYGTRHNYSLLAGRYPLVHDPAQ